VGDECDAREAVSAVRQLPFRISSQEDDMGHAAELECRVCGAHEKIIARSYCEECFGPFEVKYDLASIKGKLTRDVLDRRRGGMFRFRELLPLDAPPPFGVEVGGTPLIRAPRLGKALGIDDLHLKNDAVNHPTLSFKDRVVAVALAKAVELGFKVVGCASTGNLANSVSALSARGGLKAVILIPRGLERPKVIGTLIYAPVLVEVEGNYDDVNRLCSEIADRFPVGFVNVNLRTFYSEGSKTFGHEIAQDLGWRAPDAVVCPMAGGSLIGKIHKGFEELAALDLITKPSTKMFGAQAAGCQPIVDAFERRDHEIRPVRPSTIAKSLAIGNPADGYFASKLIASTGGCAVGVTDAELVDAIRLLAETEGIFAETAGGVAVAVAKKLAARGSLPKGGTTVVAITGNGLKTADAVESVMPESHAIGASFPEFESLAERRGFFA
jgi:threonine synthase